MLSECIYTASGGGGAYKGEFTVDQATVTVDLPFETKHLLIYRVDDSNGYKVTISYDANITTAQQVRHYVSGSIGADTLALPSTTTESLQSVSSTQFVYKVGTVANWGGKYEFIAIPM